MYGIAVLPKSVQQMDETQMKIYNMEYLIKIVIKHGFSCIYILIPDFLRNVKYQRTKLGVLNIFLRTWRMFMH